MLSGPIADSITSSGRKKGNVYHFVFGSFDGAQSFKEHAAGVARVALSLL
jgi:hypothetical protein